MAKKNGREKGYTIGKGEIRERKKSQQTIIL
jgi:hypothetical protein